MITVTDLDDPFLLTRKEHAMVLQAICEIGNNVNKIDSISDLLFMQEISARAIDLTVPMRAEQAEIQRLSDIMAKVLGDIQ